MSVATASPAWTGLLESTTGELLCLAGATVDSVTRWAESAEPAEVRLLASTSGVAPGPRATPKRRREWLAGRLAAGAALATLAPSASIAVRSGGARSGQPYGRSLEPAREWGLSVSHAGGRVMAAAADCAVGIDLEAIAPRSPELTDFAFTAAERERVGAVARTFDLTPDGALTLCWCAKEAALKLLGVGLRAPLQAVEVLFSDDAPQPVALHGAEQIERLARTSARLRCSSAVAAELGVATTRTLPVAVWRDDSHLYAVVWA